MAVIEWMQLLSGLVGVFESAVELVFPVVAVAIVVVLVGRQFRKLANYR